MTVKSMFEIEVQYGFANFVDQETVWVQADDESQAREFTSKHILDQQEAGAILSLKVIHVDDLPDGETFWTA